MIQECFKYIVNYNNWFSFLNQISGAIQGISTVVLVIVTIYYAIQTRKTVEEMEETRKYEFLPILEITMVAETYHRLRITISNIGKGLARVPKIYIPTLKKNIDVQNMGTRATQETIIEVDTDTILVLKDDKRKLRIEYLDVFSRKIVSEAMIIPETIEESHPRKNHLKLDNWNLILPN